MQFSTSDFGAWVTGQVDDQHRPIVVPSAEAIALTNNDPKFASWLGLVMPGNLKWFTDDNLPTATSPPTQTTILVGSPADMFVWEDTMQSFAYVETEATTLTVTVGLRTYLAAVPRHTAAFSYISGSAYPISLVN